MHFGVRARWSGVGQTAKWSLRSMCCDTSIHRRHSSAAAAAPPCSNGSMAVSLRAKSMASLISMGRQGCRPRPCVAPQLMCEYGLTVAGQCNQRVCKGLGLLGLTGGDGSTRLAASSFTLRCVWPRFFRWVALWHFGAGVSFAAEEVPRYHLWQRSIR
jgi:hypothetical protein